MGLLKSLTDIKSGLFGDDSETTTNTGPTSGTKTTTDSGQVNVGETINSGSTTATSGQQSSTGTQNQQNQTSGSTAQSTIGRDTSSNTSQTTGGSTTTGTSTTVNSGSTNTSTSTTGPRTDTSTVGPSTTKEVTSEQVNTSQLLLSQEAVDYLVKGILESNAGLANLTGAPKGAGIYSDTTTQMLANDLIARTAGEVAARSAVTKNVIGGTSKTISNSGYNTTTNVGAQTTSGTQTIGGSTSSTSNTSQTQANQSTIGSSVNTTNQHTSGISESTSNTTGSSTQNSTSSGVSGTGPSSSVTKNTTGPRTIQEVANTSGSQTTQEKDDKGLLDWIICSELRRQKRMSLKDYTYGGRKFLEYDDEILRGYYIWAEPSVKHLRAYPNSLYSRFLEHIFNARAKNYSEKFNPYNAVVAASVYSVCWILSRTIARNHKYVREEGVHYG